ncbi:MAG TPA: ROK family protein [Symbiobacteriaceae bacterium]|nr:ROK family protein [Symbiobacteriaceae bacterium]
MCAANRVVIALDVGGTSVKAGLVDSAGDLVGTPGQFPLRTEGDAGQILSDFEAILRELWGRAGGCPIAGIGVGMCGPMDYERGISLIQGLSKYDAIYGVNLPAEWRLRLGLPGSFPIRFANDAAVFALGESLYGAGRGRRRVMAVTLGTGCGSAFVVDGRVVTSGAGVPPEGQVYHLPFHGARIDDWISRRGILRLWSESGSRSGDVDVADLAKAARAGEVGALTVFVRFGELLAEALGPVAEAFLPDCVVVGGGIARSLDLCGGPISRRLRCAVVAASDPAPGIKGAASLILR